MPTSFTIGPDPFPAGTTVGVYLRRTLINEATGPQASPLTTAVTTDELRTTFTGLAYATEYWAAAEVGGVWLKVAFASAADPDLDLPSNLDLFALQDDLDAHAALTTAAHGLAAELADARARANHTGTQSSASISDFAEAVQDAVAALLGAGSNITLTYDDVADTLTVSAAGSTTDPEAVRDAIGVALVGAGLIGVAVDDPGDTITLSTTATANATDAALRDRATHTGAQAIATVTGLQAALDAKQPLDSDLTALAAIAPANDDVVQRKAGSWTNRTPAQLKTDLVLVKGDVGLGNVDNTSDANKPVSTAQQTALDLKATEATRSASGKGFVNHGATAGTARPSGYASVEWVGSVEPTNAANGDTWVNTA